MQNGSDRWPRAINYFIYGVFLICVLVALAGLILPMLSRTNHGAGRAACLNNLKQIITAIKTYSPDYDEYFPSSAAPGEAIRVRTHYRDLGMLYPQYVTTLEVFACPNSGDKMPKRRLDTTHDGRPFSDAEAKQVSYAYSYNGSGKKVAWTEAAPSTTRILADRHASRSLTRHSNHKLDGRSVAFADGHLRWISGRKKLLTDPDNPDPKVNNKCWWSER